MLPGPTDTAGWRINARRTSGVLAAFAWWPAIEVWRDWPWTPGKLGTEVTGLFARKLKRIPGPATWWRWRRWIAVWLWVA
ncbi:hypothetical protein BST40_07605 [Mycobacterium persicum]|nr:hypothetical protein BST40_07605 [Mycobacterium persicum]